MSFIPREIQVHKGDIYENMMNVHTEFGHFEPHHDFLIIGWDDKEVEMRSIETLPEVKDQWENYQSVESLAVDWEEFSNFRLVKRLNP